MTTWDDADPPVLPPVTPRERFRLWWRAVAASVTLAVLFGTFLMLHGIDRLRGAVGSAAWAPVAVRIWAHISLRILGLRLSVSGQPMGENGAFLANHASWIDIVVLMATADARLVSKVEVRHWPIIGWIGETIGTMFIERRSSAAKRQEQLLAERFRVGDRMALFPEGTSTDGLRVLPFKSSLLSVFFSPELPDNIAVQPVAVRYVPHEHLPQSFYGWWGNMDFSQHLISVLARSTGGRVEVAFFDPVRAADMADRKALARHCYGEVSSKFRDFTRLSQVP